MTRALLCLAMATLPLMAPQVACCRPPDQVAHSPVPPLKAIPQHRATGVVPAGPATTDTKRAPNGFALPGSPAAPAAPQTTSPRQRDSKSTKAQISNAANYSAEQAQIWNSPEMLEARQAVMEFCRRSAQTSPAEGEQFLARLSLLPPAEMRDWLQRFQARRMNVSRAQEVERVARQLTVDHALARQEAVRQAAASAADLRNQGATPAAAHFLTAPQLEPARYVPFGSTGPIGFTKTYNPFHPVFDPSSPRGYGAEVAAAMSLPGDLPRSDPRNYIRGEEGIDFGEWATFREAVPPVPPITPAVPANNPAPSQ